MQMSNINNSNSEIRSHSHLMDAEGRCDKRPSQNEVIEYIKSEGYAAVNIDIWYDDFLNCWQWNCNIIKYDSHE